MNAPIWVGQALLKSGVGYFRTLPFPQTLPRRSPRVDQGKVITCWCQGK
jgi:hypothetical protein